MLLYNNPIRSRFGQKPFHDKRRRPHKTASSSKGRPETGKKVIKMGSWYTNCHDLSGGHAVDDEIQETGGVGKVFDVHGDDDKLYLLATIILRVGIGNGGNECCGHQ